MESALRHEALEAPENKMPRSIWTGAFDSDKPRNQKMKRATSVPVRGG